MEYQDFTIDVRTVGNGQFEATAVESPIREAPRVYFSDPIPRETLDKLLKAPVSSTRELGQALYRALFQDRLADLFMRCRAGLPRDGRSGLRIRLRFSLDEEDTAYLAALPWELLCDPAGQFVAKDLST